MAMGLIASALGGGAQAVNEIADNSLAAKREKALLKVREDMQKRADQRQHGYRLQEGEVNQGYAQENAELQHGLTMERERFVQGRQDGRSAAQIAASNQGSMVQGADAEGNAVWFNPVTGQQVEGPQGVNFRRTGESGVSDSEMRQRYQVAKSLEDDLRERITMAADDGDTATQRALERELQAATQRRAALEQEVFGGYGGSPSPESAGGSSGTMDINEYLDSLLN